MRYLRAVAAGAYLALATTPALGQGVAASTADVASDIDPCVDLYDYVNARWLASASIPPDRSRWGAFDELAKRTRVDLRTILDAAAANNATAATSTTGKLLDFYRAGMDTRGIDAAGATPLSPELGRIAGIRSRDDLIDAIARLHRMGVNAGFLFTITTDASDSTRYLPELYQAGLGLPDRDYYFRTDAKSQDQRAEYVKHVARMLELLGDPTERAAAGAATIMAMETQLAGASLTAEARREPQAVTHRMSVQALAAAAPAVDWAHYLDQIGIARTQALNVAMPEFMTTFARMTTSVPVDDWKTYLRWHLVHATAGKLASPFEQENFRFYETFLQGRKEMPPRDERVIDTITGRFGNAPLAQALGQLYVAQRFPPAAKARAVALVEELRAALRTRLGQLDWMSEPTRQAALAKLDAMVLQIGYPDRWRDYGPLDVSPVSYAGKWLAVNVFETARELALLKGPVDRHEWFSSPEIINAFYQPRLNAIVLPAAILQPPFFDPQGDDAQNYGAIGTVIGHEITHGFDNHGRQFDALGNLHDWWTAEDAQRYLARSDVLVRQYGGYEPQAGLKVNGRLTLSENIADIGGLKLAYLAMERALQDRPSGTIGGLTPEQRFFVAFAREWRAKITPEFERLLVNTDPHSPHQFRVRGAIANVPEFARAFACRSESTAAGAGEPAAIW